MSQERMNHPGLAAVFSFIFNGLGQIYNGQIIKGLVIIVFSSVSLLIFIIGAIMIGGWLLGKFSSMFSLIGGIWLLITGLFFICVLGVYSIFDAYRVAEKK